MPPGMVGLPSANIRTSPPARAPSIAAQMRGSMPGASSIIKRICSAWNPWNCTPSLEFVTLVVNPKIYRLGPIFNSMVSGLGNGYWLRATAVWISGHMIDLTWFSVGAVVIIMDSVNRAAYRKATWAAVKVLPEAWQALTATLARGCATAFKISRWMAHGSDFKN